MKDKIAVISGYEILPRSRRKYPEVIKEVRKITKMHEEMCRSKGYHYENLDVGLMTRFNPTDEKLSRGDREDVDLFNSMFYGFFSTVDKSDVARVLHMRRLLREGYDYVVWMDADLFISKSFSLDMDTIKGHALTVGEETRYVQPKHIFTKYGKVRKKYQELQGIEETAKGKKIVGTFRNPISCLIVVNNKTQKGLEALDSWLDCMVEESNHSFKTNPNKFPDAWGKYGTIALESTGLDVGLHQGLASAGDESLVEFNTGKLEDFKFWIETIKGDRGKDIIGVNVSPVEYHKRSGGLSKFMRRLEKYI